MPKTQRICTIGSQESKRRQVTEATGYSKTESIRPVSIRPTSAPNTVVPRRFLGRSAPM